MARWNSKLFTDWTENIELYNMCDNFETFFKVAKTNVCTLTLLADPNVRPQIPGARLLTSSKFHTVT